MRYRMLFFTVPGVALIVSLAGCGSEQPKDAASKPPAGAKASPSAGEPATDLTITVKASEQAPAKTFTLTCDPLGGTLPSPAAACAALKQARDKAPDPFAPVPKGQMCPQVYGGPETATVTGTWNGKRVNADFSRKDGCEMARWDRLAPLFGKAA